MSICSTGVVIATAAFGEHVFSKQSRISINLIKGLGVEGDCHFGETVQHRSRLHIQPPPPNLRQVHLMPEETLSDLDLQPSELGENITTSGIDLVILSVGTRLHFVDSEMEESEALAGEHPVITIRGLRNPCPQIEKHRNGLQEKFVVRDENRKIIKRLAGVMGTVEVGGVVSVGVKILVEEPAQFEALGCV